ncbi:MAG: sulfatase [Planctomycetota bacterium]|nr:sulfatase [Planctomycetota bacterium]
MRINVVRLIVLVLATISGPSQQLVGQETAGDRRPNILIAIADDWGWPHAGAYQDPVVKTPTFDRLAAEGAVFHHAYVSSPSCTPSRGAILTGQWHWRLEGAGNLWSVFPDKFETYPELLARAGYVIGSKSKAWGPGRTETASRQPAGPSSKSPDPQALRDFIETVPDGQPWCFWLGSHDPHRGFIKDSGAKSGIDLSKIKLFGHFPDCAEIRGDVADYYLEVQRFDRVVGQAIADLEAIGQLDNTLIVMTGDHGMPFPRCKSNNYDSGARVPLAIRWPGGVKAGTVVNDFVSLVDLAPTFCQAGDVALLEDFSGTSLLPLLGDKNTTDRSYVIHGKERHVPAQETPNMGGYPTRAIRTHDFLYLHNFYPDRWPAGTPDHEKAALRNAWLADCDNGPTKSYIVQNRDKDAAHRLFYQLSFGKRPADELYDLKKDPDQLVNVAEDSQYQETLERLKNRLFAELKKTGDPRVTGEGPDFDQFPYLGGAPRFPGSNR